MEVRRQVVALSDERDIAVVEAGEQQQQAIVHNGTPSETGLIEENISWLWF